MYLRIFGMLCTVQRQVRSKNMADPRNKITFVTYLQTSPHLDMLPQRLANTIVPLPQRQ